METTSIRVVIQRRCEVCGGTGETRSEEWASYEEWSQTRHERLLRQTPETYFLDFLGMDSVPPMNRECGACDDGWTDDAIPFDDLVSHVLAHVPKTVIPPAELRDVAEKVRRSITAAASKSQGLADPDEAGSWLRTVQEGAAALREVTELVVRGD